MKFFTECGKLQLLLEICWKLHFEMRHYANQQCLNGINLWKMTKNHEKKAVLLAVLSCR